MGVVLAREIQNRWHHKSQETAPNVQSGLWGDLQTWDFRLEQPAEYRAFFKLNADGPFWNFGAATPEEVRSILIGCGCTDDQVERLMATFTQNGTGSFLKPDDATILSLSPDARSNLYLALARNPANSLYANPFMIAKGDVGALLKAGKFRQKNKIADLISKLSYARNGYIYFSDPEVVLRHLGDDTDDHAELLKCLLGTDAVMGRLLIKPDSNLDAAILYWGLTTPGVLLKDTFPIFEAQKQLPEGGAIPLSYLLPPLARNSLYKTPTPAPVGEKLPDCHWTALNFFNRSTDPAWADNEYAARYIAANYYEIAKPGINGDLVLIFNNRNEVIHSAVYLAADIVYTKNGVNLGSPWVLMREKNMVGLFSALEPVKVGYFRRNDY